jgi:hypothetical protein
MKLNVQYWLDDDEKMPDNEYEAIRCLACGGLHLINRKTGKLLGQNRGRAAGGADDAVP